jgi:hypothetical protein
MAIIPTPEETALAILDIFVNFVNHFELRPGDVLDIRKLKAVWFKRGLAAEDFAPGMEFAVQQGWIEIIRKGASFMLTAAGYAKA